MRTGLITAVAFFVLVSTHALFADMKIVYESEKKGDSKKTSFRKGESPDTSVGKAIVYFKPDKCRMEDPTGNLCPTESMTIYRLDKGVMWIVKRNTKVYEEYNLEQMSKLPTFGKIEVETEKTEETKVIKKYRCTRFVTKIKNPSPRMTITHTTWATDEIDTEKAMEKFIERAVEALKGISMLQASFKYQKDLIDEGVFPVKTESESSFMGRGSTTTTTLDSFSTDPLDDELFEVPEGYVKKPVNLGEKGM
jgi:hypothetical protein